MPSAEHFDVTAEEYYFSINGGGAYSDDDDYSETNDPCYIDDCPYLPFEEEQSVDVPATNWMTVNLGGALYDVSDTGYIKASGLFHPAVRGLPAHGTPYHYFEWYDVEMAVHMREWMHVIVYMAFNKGEEIPEGWEVRHTRSQPRRFYSNALAHLAVFPKIV